MKYQTPFDFAEYFADLMHPKCLVCGKRLAFGQICDHQQPTEIKTATNTKESE